MKHFVTAILILLPITINASIIKFECKAPEVEGIHKFEAKGILSVDEYNKVDGILSIQVQKAQAEGSIQLYEEIPVTGTFQHFKAGEFANNSFDQFTLFTREAYIKNLNLLVDLKVEIASQVLSIDNFLYRSNCYTVTNSSNK
jgi:hypothetical protein